MSLVADYPAESSSEGASSGACSCWPPNGRPFLTAHAASNARRASLRRLNCLVCTPARPSDSLSGSRAAFTHSTLYSSWRSLHTGTIRRRARGLRHVCTSVYVPAPCSLRAGHAERLAGDAVDTSSDESDSSVDSATRRSRAAAALVQNYGDAARAGRGAPAAAGLPGVQASFAQVRACAAGFLQRPSTQILSV